MKAPSAALVEAVLQLEQGRLTESARAELLRSLLRDADRAEGFLLAWRSLPAAEQLLERLPREQERTNGWSGWWQLLYSGAAVGTIALAIALGGRSAPVAPPVTAEVSATPADVVLLASFEPRPSDLFHGDFE
jgi:hypothetical protein